MLIGKRLRLQGPPRRRTLQSESKVQNYEPATMKYFGYHPALTLDEVFISGQGAGTTSKEQKKHRQRSSKDACFFGLYSQVHNRTPITYMLEYLVSQSIFFFCCDCRHLGDNLGSKLVLL